MLERNSQSNISQVREKYFSSIEEEQSSERVVDVISRITSVNEEAEETRKNVGEEEEERGGGGGGENNKRVVLKEIVNMLNTKYHKNIKIK